ncbi:hypothetical protein K0M31_009488 [Melipona bicolor]|uniref:Uncharacterized protein n=1 Tax=Melipona bicolor TaxID=60889 RepID=A0AA40FNU4_9HYME|nr:hypothetical protein K0M31_009488 [Melipona bicolor]
MIASNQSSLKTFLETIVQETGYGVGGGGGGGVKEKLARKMSSGKYETVKKEEANPRKVLAEAAR